MFLSRTTQTMQVLADMMTGSNMHTKTVFSSVSHKLTSSRH
jgi:hypothetical protein